MDSIDATRSRGSRDNEQRAHLPLQRGLLTSGFFAALRLRDFRHLFAGNVLWWQTMFMETIVVGWLVFDITGSAWQVALVGFCRSIPLLLFGSVGGLAADRFGRRSVILTAQMAILIVHGAVAVVIAMGILALWHLALAAFVLGTAWAVDWPSRRALLPDLVGKERTVEAMFLENMGQGVSRILGPSLAGTLIAFFGPLGCYLAMVVLSSAAFMALSGLSHRPIARTNMRPSTSPWTLLGESVRYVGRSQPILGVLLITVVVNLLLIPYMTLLPVFASDVLAVGPAALGFLGAAAGMGAFAGLLLINWARRYASNGWILTLGTFHLCVMIFAFSQSQIYGLSWVTLFLAGVGQACFGIMQSSIVLLSASDEMRSRTMGMLVLAIGADPFGKLQTGALSERFGVSMALGLQATVAAIGILAITLLLPGLRTRAVPTEAAHVEGD